MIGVRFQWIMLCLLSLIFSVITGCDLSQKEPVKVGILHAMSGPMAERERPLVDAALFAVEELNQQGGVLGRRIQAIAADSQSQPEQDAQEAIRLIDQEKVVALFGCGTSACRQAVQSVVEARGVPLFYSLPSAGMEHTPFIIDTGPLPNQQIIPALRWALDNLGRRLYLVGSDDVFSHGANRLIKDWAAIHGVEMMGEKYLPLGSDDAVSSIDAITATKPDVVINTLTGSSNVAFFSGLERAGLSNGRQPVISFRMAERELAVLSDLMTGTYAAWGYFQSLDTPYNREFVARFQQRFGQNRVVDDPMEATYLGVKLWAQGVMDAQNVTPDQVNRTILGQSLESPQGIVSVDPETRHLWRMVRIGRAQPDGQFAIIWSSNRPVRPTLVPGWYEAL